MAAAWPPGDGEAAKRLRAFAWCATPLGPVERWPATLKHAVEMVLAAGTPMAICWGREATYLANDAMPLVGPDGQRAAIGRPAREALGETWHTLGTLSTAVLDGAGALFHRDRRVLVERNARLEHIRMDFGLSPIDGGDGTVGGVLVIAAERTDDVMLRESEEKYRSLFETMDEGFALCELVRDEQGQPTDYRYVELNLAFERQVGIPRVRAQGRLRSQVLDSVPARSLEAFARVVALGEPARFEHYERQLDRWYDVRVLPRGGDRFAMLYDDITTTKRVVEALRESEARHSFLLALNDRLRTLADPRAIMSAAAEMLGRHLSLALVQYRLYEDGDWSEPVAGYSDGISRFARSRLSTDAPGWFERLKRGEPIFCDDTEREAGHALAADRPRSAGVRAAAVIPLLRDGDLAASLSIADDEPRQWTDADQQLCGAVAERTWAIIERARAQSALRVSEEQMRIAMKAARMFAWTVDAESGRTSFSPNHEAAVGLPPSPLGATAFAIVDHRSVDDDRERMREAVQRTIAGDGDLHVEHRARDPRTGAQVWLDTHGTRIVDETTGAARIVGVTQNIDERKRLDLERAALLSAAKMAQANAEAANRAKDDFLATLSHELRTPLAPILLWARALRSGGVPPSKLAQAVHAIVESAESQERLIEDLLDLSRLQAGKLVLVRGRTSIEKVVRAALEVVRPSAVAKGVALELAVDPALPDANLDAGRVQQVLWNLLSNAVKFTPSGGRVSLRAGLHDGRIELVVADTGQGISPEFLPHLFQRFRQQETGDDRSHTGLGIGLALCRHLVELHEGTIEARTDGPGRGATFTVRLPYLPPVDEARVVRGSIRPADQRSLKQRRVLVVEDDDNTRDVLRFMLEHEGADVVAVGSGGEALEAVEQVREAPAVIVCDIGLPGMSGYELIGEIARRRRGRGEPPIPACALSAHVRDVDRRRALEAGFDMHIAKPVDADALIEVVKELAELSPIE